MDEVTICGVVRCAAPASHLLVIDPDAVPPLDEMVCDEHWDQIRGGSTFLVDLTDQVIVIGAP